MTLRGQRIGHHWYETYSKESFLPDKPTSWLKCYKVPSRLQQALAFPPKFVFLFNKVTFHFRMIFPKKLWDQKKLWGSQPNHESWQVWNVKDRTINMLQTCNKEKKSLALKDYKQSLIFLLNESRLRASQSHADVPRGTSRVPSPLTSTETSS